MTPGTCVHFTGLRSKTDCCKAGVCYYTAFGSAPGTMLRMPCVQYRCLPAHGRGTYIKPGEDTARSEIDRRGQVMIPCNQYLEPTPAQVEQDRIESEAALAKHLAAIQVAGSWRVRPKPARDRAEVVECPVCKGRLHLSQSSHNGHVHGACETVGCVRWME